MSAADYQVVIVGGGPAGLTAGLYASRARLSTVLLEKGAVGGQVLLTDWVDNYPGFPEGIAGYELIERITAQAARFGLQTRYGTVTGFDLSGPEKSIFLEGGEKITSQAVIIATGARPNRLGVVGEEEFSGKGVSYCATCDGPFFKGLEVAVVGGGNTAIQEACFLTKFASLVTVIHRRDELRATKILQEKALNHDRIRFLWNSKVVRIIGSSAVAGVEGVEVEDKGGARMVVAVQGVFVFVGIKPNNEMLPLTLLGGDSRGFVVTDGEMRTKVPGVMAVGDIRSKQVRQIVNAAGEGAVAVLSVEDYLSGI